MSLQTLQGFQQAQCAVAAVVIGSRWFQRLTFGNGRTREKHSHDGFRWQESQYGTTKNCHKQGARVLHLVVQDLSQNKPTNDANFNICLFRSSKHVHAQNRGNISIPDYLDVSRTTRHQNTSYDTAWTDRKKQDMIAWVKGSGRFTIDRSLKWTRPDIQDMIDKTRWLLNADFFFQKENMSMTAEMVQGHSDVGLRDKHKKSGTKQRLREDMCVFILWHSAIIKLLTKMLMLRFECGSMTGTTLKNSENYHVSGFASGSFHAVSTVCPPAPNVDRRGSEMHLFHQRPDHRLHFTNHVCCQVIGLRITSCPLFCRNIDVTRLLSRKLGFPRQDPVRSHHQLPVSFSIFRRANVSTGQGCVTPFHGTPTAWTHLCAVSHMDVVEANTCQCIMFVVAFLASDQQATSWKARTATSAKRFVSDSVSFGIIGVRFVQHRALPTPPAAPHVRPPRPRLPRAASLKARLGPLCQSGGARRASRPCALLRLSRFIGQADGWWSRVDALDPCRGVPLLSLSSRNRALSVFQ